MQTRGELDVPDDLRVRVEFEYDARDRRTCKTVHRWDGGAGDWQVHSVTRFVWAGWLLLAELDGLDGDALLRSYAWGQHLGGGVGGLLSVTDHARGLLYYAGRDGNGNVTALADAATGATVAAYEYAPGGLPVHVDALDAAAVDVSRFLFSTKYFDAEIGLYYYGYRYYDPSAGRWISRDPIGEAGGLNLNEFVDGDPINGWDPDGRKVTFIPRGDTGDMDWKSFKTLLETRGIQGYNVSLSPAENGFEVTGQASTPRPPIGPRDKLAEEEASWLVKLINAPEEYVISSVDDLHRTWRRVTDPLRALAFDSKAYGNIKSYLESLDQGTALALARKVKPLADNWDKWAQGNVVAGGIRRPGGNPDTSAFEAHLQWARLAWVHSAKDDALRNWGGHVKVGWHTRLNDGSIMKRPGEVLMDPAFAWNRARDYSRSNHGSPTKPRGFNNTARNTRGIFSTLVHESTHEIGGGYNTWNNRDGINHPPGAPPNLEWKKLEEGVWARFDHPQLQDFMRWTPERMMAVLKGQVTKRKGNP